MWQQVNVRWEFVSPLCASVPGKSSLIEKWLTSRQPKTRPAQGPSLRELSEEVIATLPEVTSEEYTLVFQRDPADGKLIVRMATIRAHLKDCARVLSSMCLPKIKGERSLSVRVNNGLYWPIEQPYLPIQTKTESFILQPHGIREKAIHAMTSMGPINALKAFEYVENAVLTFPLLVLVKSKGELVVLETEVESLFAYGGIHGYAGERSEDGGRYVATFRLEGHEPFLRKS